MPPEKKPNPSPTETPEATPQDSQPETLHQSPPESGDGVSDAPDFEVPEFEAEALPDDPDAPQADAGHLIDADGFIEMFRGLCAAPNIALAMMREQPLEALKVEADDPSARAASDALFEIVEETPALHFLLDPSSVWLKRTIVIGTFVVPRALAARGEWVACLVARQREAMAPEDAPQADDPMNKAPSAPAGNVVVAFNRY
ncbi:MAG: hypothetical protein ACFB0Z_01890, partial [Candidatus Phaeomarinobacter sp.]